jgi:hypothetical protein
MCIFVGLDPAWLQKAFSFGGEEYLHSTAGDDDSYARVLMWKHWIEGDLPWNPRRQLIYYHRPVVGKRSPTCPDILSNRSSSSAGSGEGFRIMVRETGYYGGDKRRKNSNPPPLLIEFGCWTPGLEGVDKDFVFEVPYYC